MVVTLWKCQFRLTKTYRKVFIVLFRSNSGGANIAWKELSENVSYYFIVTPSKCIMWYELWKMCVVLFGSNSLKMSVLFDLNSDKKCVVLFCSNSLKCQNCLIWNLKLSNYCFLCPTYLWTYLRQRFYRANRKKIILKYSLLILKSIFYFLMQTNTWQLHLLNWQGLGPVWVIFISFVYAGLLVSAFP